MTARNTAILMGLMFAVMCSSFSQQPVFIRVNQAGFLPSDFKSGVLISRKKLDGSVFRVVNEEGQTVYNAPLRRNSGASGGFEYHYRLDFSPVRAPGRYKIEAAGTESYPFRIGDSIYYAILDSLLAFFTIQRCGDTSPALHSPCHLHDATRLITNTKVIRTPLDVSGGWHDAGDYVKFLNTAAFTTYTLLLTYELNPATFTADRDGNLVPDILDEAKVGVDWLMKLSYANFTLVTQVQDLRDHDQGWRMPEDDLLARDRPGFIGIGKNLVGIYSATMALTYRIWSTLQLDDVYADRCLTLAENYYSSRNRVPNIDNTTSGPYRDKRYLGKMALAAVELHLATGRSAFLTEGKAYADSAGSDYWWSWGDINAYALYRLAKIEPRFKNYLLGNLTFFKNNKNKRIFGEAVQDSWGSNTALLGAALQAVLWNDLTGESTFDTLAIMQRDFILGRNQWGVSFVYGIGSNYSRNLHSQVGYFNKGHLTGAVAAGPISKAKLDQYNIPFEQPDIYEEFQTPLAYYRDDRMDYVTNEPTIVTNATAVFVMAYYAGTR